MSELDHVIAALQQALSVTADKIPLQKHLAELLLKNHQLDEAERLFRDLLLHAPDDSSIQYGLAQAFFQQGKGMMAIVVLEALIKKGTASADSYLLVARAYHQVGQIAQAQSLYQQAILRNPTLADPAFEAQLDLPAGPAPTPIVPTLGPDAVQDKKGVDDIERISVDDWPRPAEPELERSKTTFADVGGMDAIKDDIRMKIIHPLKNRELYKMYGKAAGGGILMYGPPGCGKTYLARATAGEVNASFASIGIHDVLNMYLGQSEGNLHNLFEMARRNKPCVLFIDEVDALGASRTDMRQSAGRHLINQLLAEMDGVEASNDSVLILAASNAPWHIDSALRRPGRFDQVIFVPPPDASGRASILKSMLKDKPTEAIDYEQLARETDGFSGADLKGTVDRAVEGKLREAMRQGSPVPLTARDLLRAAGTIKPSTKEWFATARNYALYSNEAGTYDDVLTYLKMNTKSGNSLSKFFFGGDE